MAYTDLTTEFDYKDLLTWQNMDKLAENDALFQARWTGDATDGLIPGPLRVTNNVYIKWRNQAGAADVNGLKLNASDQLEMGASLKTPTLTVDPTANLEASTKQYVDAGSMKIGLVARISAQNTTTSYVDVINITAAGRFRGLMFNAEAHAEGGINYVNTIIDGVDYGTLSPPNDSTEQFAEISDVRSATMFAMAAGSVADVLDSFFKTSLRVQHKSSAAGRFINTTIVYERQA